AVAGEAKMPGLDDAGMHRPDWNLMQPFAFYGEELVGLRLGGLSALAERRAHGPEAEIEPGAIVRAVDGVEAMQIAHGALEFAGRWMARRDAGIGAVLASVAHHRDVAEIGSEQRHVHHRRIAPQPEQRAAALREQIDRLRPAVRSDVDARPWPVRLDGSSVRDAVEQSHGAIPTTAPRSGIQPLAPAACRCQPRTRWRDARTSERRRLPPERSPRAARRKRWC